MGLKPRATSQPFAFRFYGCEPIEWREGANDGHRYEIAFRDDPDAKAKEAIAGVWESSLKTGLVSPASARPWRWAGKSAALFLGERDLESAATVFFGAVRSAFERLNHACAIEEVVFRGAWWEPGSGPWGRGSWDAWSVGRRREPISAFSSSALGNVDAGFERARRVARLGEKMVLAAEEKEVARLAAGAMSLAPLKTKPVAFAIPPDAARALGVRYKWQVLGSASGRVYTKPSSTTEPVSWLADDGAAMHWKQASIGGVPVVGTSGTHMLVAIDAEAGGHQVVLIDLAEGSSRPVWRTKPEDAYVRGLWLGGSCMAVMTKTLRLFELGESGAVEVASDGEENQAAHLMFGLFGDRVLLTAKSYGGINAYRIDRGALELFGQVPNGAVRLKHWPLPQCDAKRLTGLDEKSHTPIEVLNIEACWKAAFGAPL